jgi:UDP-N-acetylmuramoyl-tripeptide--D-alanyl-D-alanine ligase
MKLTVKDIAAAIGGRIVRGSDATTVKGVSINSRTLCAGDAFFAISGDNFNGSDFAEAATKSGASCVVVSEQDAQNKNLESVKNLVVVDDTLTALGDFAARVRTSFKKPLIAVSGSSGKTTTKEMMASILSCSGSVCKTEGNKNNLVGLPLTLFGLVDKDGSAVVELGISEKGEMRRLAEIAAPDVAVLTNIGRAHMEGLGSMDNVAKEKFELFDGVIGNPDKAAVIAVNMDDERIAAYAESLPKERVVTFGSRVREGRSLDVLIRELALEKDGLKVNYIVRGEEIEIKFASPLRTNAINAAAAIAATLPLGVAMKDIVKGLRTFTQLAGRMEVLRAGKVVLLDDSYNANPDSVGEAIKSLVEVATLSDVRSVAILGDMLELGAQTERFHREVGAVAKALNVGLLIAVGKASEATILGAKNAGMDDEDVLHFASNNEAIKALKAVIMEGDLILVKGSRSSRMEEVVEGILEIFQP